MNKSIDEYLTRSPDVAKCLTIHLQSRKTALFPWSSLVRSAVFPSAEAVEGEIVFAGGSVEFAIGDGIIAEIPEMPTQLVSSIANLSLTEMKHNKEFLLVVRIKGPEGEMEEL